VGSSAHDLAPLRRTLGDLLAAFRTAAGFTQQRLADAVGYARVTVATAESGHRQPAVYFWTRCDDVLDTGGELGRTYRKLTAARARYKRDAIELDQADRSARVVTEPRTDRPIPVPIPTPGREVASGLSESENRRPAGDIQRRADLGAASSMLLDTPFSEVIDYLEQHWHVLVKADNLLGPVHALGAVQELVALIERLLPNANPQWQGRLWRLGAKYSESAAWLLEDIGDQPAAARWTSRALEWAHAANDQAMVCWALFRRSQQAATDGDVARSVALAHAAARDLDRLTAPMRAAVVQQHAVGLALAGDERASLNRLDEALASAAPPDRAGDAARGHGSFCTASYLQMQRANCWLLLGHPDRAAPAYQVALASAPEAYHRDRGHGLARLGHALAATGEIEQAAACSSEALRIGVTTGSGRILTEVRQTVRRLGAHVDVPAVGELAAAVSRLGPAA
jgi:tetratricopeptide (TPR) repeat protein/DNA-binding XRE family transcriptional regulator